MKGIYVNMKNKKLIILIIINILLITLIISLAISFTTRKNTRQEIENILKNEQWKIRIRDNDKIYTTYYLDDNYIIKQCIGIPYYLWDYNTTIYYFEEKINIEDISKKLSSYQIESENSDRVYYIKEKENQSYTALQTVKNEINSILEKSNSKKHTTIYK